MLNQTPRLDTPPAVSVGHCIWCQDVQVVLVVPAGYCCLVCDRTHAAPPPTVPPPAIPTTDAVDVWEAYHHQCDRHALHQQAQTDWIDDTTSFDAHAAEKRFRAVLADGLTRVASATRPDPATVAQQVSFQVVSAGDTCGPQDVMAPGVCASLTITTVRTMREHQLVVTTLAQAVEGGERLKAYEEASDWRRATSSPATWRAGLPPSAPYGGTSGIGGQA